MVRLAIGAFFTAALLCVAVCILKRAEGPAHPVTAIVPETPYAVVVKDDGSTVDLDFSNSAQYTLVVGSLDSFDRLIRVECASRPLTVVSHVPVKLLEPISARAAATPVAAGQRASDWRTRSVPSAQTASSPSTKKSEVSDAEKSMIAKAGATAVAGPVSVPPQTAVRSFSLHVTDGDVDDPRQYATIPAHQVGEGKEVRVFLDDQQSPNELARGLVETIIQLFDNEVIPSFRRVLGSYRDVDGDGKFTVLLSPWLARLQGGKTCVGGFVRGSDFQLEVHAPFSNHCDMMYVNSRITPGPHLRALLIHEYAHAICFSRRSPDAHKGGAPDEEDWISEAIAHCAENMFQGGWTNLDYRVSRFLDDTAAYPLVVSDYYRPGLWRCHGCRGATYLFLRYCLDQFGDATLTRLIDNRARGRRNIELATGYSFETLFRGWTFFLLDAQRAPSKSVQRALGSLDLYGNLGNWGLAGVRRHQWNVDGQPTAIDLKGTAVAFFDLQAQKPSAARRIQLKWQPGTRMQVSLIRWQENAPRIGLAAGWTRPQAAETANLPGKEVGSALAASSPRIRAQIAIGAPGWEIEQLSAEQNVAEIRSSICLRQPDLAHFERTDLPYSRSTGGAPRRIRHFEIPADRFLSFDSPLLIKVVAVDHNGRRAAGWAALSSPRLATPQIAQRQR